MAEYYAVLSKAVAGLTESAEARRTVYDKARNALIGQLKAIDPPLPTAEISRQRLELEEAIRRVERETAAAAMTAGPKAPPHGYAPDQVAAPVEPGPSDVFRQAVEDAGTAAGRQVAGNHRTAYPSEPVYQPPPPEPYQTQPAPREPYQPPPQPADPYQQPPETGQYRAPQPAQPEYEQAEPYQQPAAPVAPAPPPPPIDQAPRQQPVDEMRAIDDDYNWEQNPPPAAASDPYAGAGQRDLPPMRAYDRPGPDRVVEPVRRSKLPAIILTILILALMGGLAAIGWNQRDTIGDLIASFDESSDGSASIEAAPAPQRLAEPSSEPAKVADRLDAEANSNVRVVGAQQEGTEVTLAPEQPGAQSIGAEAATLYEEPTDPKASGAGVVAIDAVVNWSFSGTDPASSEVVADLSVPDRNMTIRVAISKNLDDTLPASHLVEITSGGSVVGISQIPRLVFKATESGRGQPLVGAAAKVAGGLFWIGLSSNAPDVAFNVDLMRERNWIDLPLVYESGQRAILTFEKGTSGMDAFNRALSAWGN
jgi:hypothetical protein